MLASQYRGNDGGEGLEEFGGADRSDGSDIQDVSVKIIGSTAIRVNRIRLVAVVGGNEVTNPFVVAEVYVQQDGKWKLGSLSFTRLLGQ